VNGCSTACAAVFRCQPQQRNIARLQLQVTYSSSGRGANPPSFRIRPIIGSYVEVPCFKFIKFTLLEKDPYGIPRRIVLGSNEADSRPLSDLYCDSDCDSTGVHTSRARKGREQRGHQFKSKRVVWATGELPSSSSHARAPSPPTPPPPSHASVCGSSCGANHARRWGY
jgi:hypothetical protein